MAGRPQGAARGAAVHSLLEWSARHGWREPDLGVVRLHASTQSIDPDAPGAVETLLEPLRAWLGSTFLVDRVAPAGPAVRAEAPFLLGIGAGGDGRRNDLNRRTVLRGSIDLLVERDGEPPLVVDYKTDRLDGASPQERAARYETQRDVYALAVAGARGAAAVEVAYVFLERPGEPVLSRLDPPEMEAGRRRLAETIARISGGEFPPAPPEQRGWALCEGCPALGRLCSGPEGV